MMFWSDIPEIVRAWVLQEIYDQSTCRTQKEFGKKIGKSRSHVSNLLNGTFEITEKTMRQIIQRLNISETELHEILTEQQTLYALREEASQRAYPLSGKHLVEIQDELGLDEEGRRTFWQKIREFFPSEEMEQAYWDQYATKLLSNTTDDAIETFG